MRAIIISLALLVITFVATGCNTVEGMGQDIQKGGRAIERSADEHK